MYIKRYELNINNTQYFDIKEFNKELKFALDIKMFPASYNRNENSETTILIIYAIYNNFNATMLQIDNDK